eukprot:Hpha_TRINITY_DN16733_c1_g2::TRINITY_DN16733_c1_g2_i15::g.80354::m.80354
MCEEGGVDRPDQTLTGIASTINDLMVTTVYDYHPGLRFDTSSFAVLRRVVSLCTVDSLRPVSIAREEVAKLHVVCWFVEHESFSHGCLAFRPLPHKTLVGLWESLRFSPGPAAPTHHPGWCGGLMSKVFRVAFTVVFPDAEQTAACSRVIVLHGPADCGKTSLCQAVAQKLSIRLPRRQTDAFERVVLVEWQRGCGGAEEALAQAKAFAWENTTMVVVLLLRQPGDIRYGELDQVPANMLVMITREDPPGPRLADIADVCEVLTLPDKNMRYLIVANTVNSFTARGTIAGQLLSDDPAHAASHHSEPCGELHKMLIPERGMTCRGMRRLPFLVLARMGRRESVGMGVFLDALCQELKDRV